MRCRPGDLAVIISDPDPRNIGGFVRVIGRAGPSEFVKPVPGGGYEYAYNDWACEVLCVLYGSLAIAKPGDIVGVDDVDLKPIRGDEEADSILKSISILEEA